MTSETQLMRLNTVMEKTGWARSTVWAKCKAGVFPQPVRLGGCTVWVGAEVDAFIRDTIAAARTPKAAA